MSAESSPVAPQLENKREIVSWALYDWANSAFATTVLAGFFPVFYKQYWHASAEAKQVTFELGLFSSISGVIVMFLAPILGAIADRGTAKKRMLFFFCMVGAISTAGMYLVGKGAWLSAGTLFTLGVLGFLAANVFYDALLVAIAPPEKSDFVSALGYSFGYLGGAILFAINVWMTLKPTTFGLPDAAAAIRLSFLMTGIWWAAFSIPLFLFVKEPVTRDRLGIMEAARFGIVELKATFQHIRSLRPVWLFLIAYWLYIDGVDTIIRMAVNYGENIGLGAQDLIKALLLTQCIGFPAAIAFAKLASVFGTRRSLYFGLFVYLCVTIYASMMNTAAEFYGLAVAIGLVQGGVQALSRSYYSRLIPPEKAGQFFGFYNMLGKFAAVIGPIMVGVTAMVTGDPRKSILSLVVLFIGGMAVLHFVPDPQEKRLET